MNESLSRSILVNTLWTFVGRIGYLSVALLGNLVLVRLLNPYEFGQMGIIMFFIIISTVLIESGLSGALIRKENVTDIDYSTVFIFNFIISLMLMFVLIFISELISEFYKDESLKLVLIFSSLTLLISSLRITQNTRLMKEMRFKEKSLYEFIAISIASVIAIFLALNGAGVWSLVLLQLSSSIVLTALLWIFVGSLKSYKFSLISFKKLYKFGFNTTLASLLDGLFNGIYQLILGKYFSISQAGYFYQAKQLQEMPIGILQTTILGVVYSALSKIQNDLEKFNFLYIKIVKFFTIMLALVCMLMFFYSDIIVFILYGGKWSESVIYFKLLIVASFFYLQEVFSRMIFKIFDRTELILKLEIFKKTIQIVTIFYGVWILNVYFLLYGLIFTNIISFLVSYYFSRKIRKYFYCGNLKDIVLVMCITIFIVLSGREVIDLYGLSGMKSLFILPLLIIFYFCLLRFFNLIDFRKDYYMLKLLLSMRH